MRHLTGSVRRPAATGLAPALAWRDVSSSPARALQAKLRVDAGRGGDALEREADQVAVRALQSDGGMTHARMQPWARPQLRVPDLQRMCSDCQEEERAQLKARDGAATPATGGAVTDTVASAISAPGRPLPAAEQRWFGARMGADFSDVRVHDDQHANASARALEARAYTVGRHVVFGRGEFAPQSRGGRFLLAHELAHVVQQGKAGNGNAAGGQVQRWAIGAALPATAPADWQLVPPEHVVRLGQAEAAVRSILGSRQCQRYFAANCSAGAPDSLQTSFDNAQVFHRNADDTTVGMQLGVSPNIAYNTRAFRIGRWYMASTLLHEIFHTCDSNFDINDERQAENAAEACHLHTPLLDTISPASGGVGTRVVLEGTNFGGAQGRFDHVEVGGVAAPVISWGFIGGAGNSGQRVVIEIPAGAVTGDVVVINNNVRSNPRVFTVT